MTLPVLFQQFIHLLSHRKSTLGILRLSAHDQDRAVKEVDIGVGHPEYLIWPHSLPEHDDGYALEGLRRESQIFEFLLEGQNMDVWDFLWKRLYLPCGVFQDEFVVDGHV